ncbi:DUF2160 domain-containing protein [Desulfohalobium retbaense]|jgi:predicted small integral membrane protein|uniref:Small integral membrane protein n=1 Tax=Desulfohalobium retbaense (strain ATCC 49708 / DSM 5692 / JCM 16813 / HR100) TaxID=485915 RepID=C8X4A6_DESRD|nr:DUF2160 family membrane protein [Desulfohalobium retbaense]ACV69380.1 Protein of unknown function DUF2160, transmembrane [Desulfohalobium retbaense DSM 5692]
MLHWFQDFTSWMYWTLPSVLGIGGLFAAIGVMTVWDVLSPSVARKGFLPITTTRGDRFFIGIISTIAIFLIWLAFLGQTQLWAPLGISIVWFAIEGIWG